MSTPRRFNFQPGNPANLGAKVTPEMSALLSYIQDLERRISKGLTDPSGFDSLTYLPSEPARYWAGMYVMADGTNWDPGSGEGLYRRNAANSAWVFIG